MRGRVAALYTLLLLANVGAWAWALVAFRAYPLLLGTGLLAYGLGLRHAVDADHIAAIDNVTRKLMQDGQRPVGVGLFFSLGHSTVVVLASVAIAATALALSSRLRAYHDVGGIIGTLVSATFLLTIALINLFILVAVWRTFQRVRRGGPLVEEDLDTLLAGRGLLARLHGEQLRVDGVPVGQLLDERPDEAPEPGGSCIAVLATDAPLTPPALERLARRAGLGLARAGSVAHHGSGEIFVAFATATERSFPDSRDLDALFQAAVDAAEEAVLCSLWAAVDTVGREGRLVRALPRETVLELYRGRGR